MYTQKFIDKDLFTEVFVILEKILKIRYKFLNKSTSK